MSSKQVLALRWRPQSFAEMVGQEHVLKPLEHALTTQNLHHAYLFSGTRGVGKTTLARLLARALNCAKGISAEPCGECKPCKAILAGHFTDMIEIDAASRTQVEDTRELLGTVMYAPMEGRYKVYLIDEVHMLSGHSFNALLKTLEEPPEHVCFLFATTEPEKIPATIISRCLQFNLRSLSEEVIGSHLRKVLDADQVQSEDEALQLLAQAAQGSVRDALTLTEQAIAHGAGELKANAVAAMLGTLDRSAIRRLLQAVAMADGAQLMKEVEEVATLGADPAKVMEQLLQFLYETALAQIVPDVEVTEAAKEMASELEAEEVQLYYQIVLTSHRDLRFCPNPWIGFKMCALRLLAFAPGKGAPAAAPSSSSVAAASSPVVPAAPAGTVAAPAVASATASAPVANQEQVDRFSAQTSVRRLLEQGGTVLPETVSSRPPSTDNKTE